MEIKELVRLQDGSTISLSCSEAEHKSIFQAGVHALLSAGFLVLSAKDGEVIGTEEAIREVETAQEEAEGTAKH